MVSKSNSLNPSPQKTSEVTLPLAKTAVIGFYGLAVLFNLCLIAQLITVGLAYFHDPIWWNSHVWLVRGYSSVSLILLGWAYWQPFSRRIRTLTLSLPLLLGLQFLTIHLQISLPLPLAVAHPLIGFGLFSASTTLVHRVWGFMSSKLETCEPDSIEG